MPRPKALDAFMARKAEIDAMLARLQALSDDHFGANPERVDWSHVGSLAATRSTCASSAIRPSAKANTPVEPPGPPLSPALRGSGS